MAAFRSGLIRRTFSTLWLVLDRTRRVTVNLLFLALLVVLFFATFGSPSPRVAGDSALVLDIHGDVVEQGSATGGPLALAESLGQTSHETQLRDVVAVLDAAATDPRIPHAVLVLDDMQGAGLAKLREIAAAMDRFKAAGKPIFAWGSSYSQAQYFLATHANEVYLHPQGMVMLRGLGRVQNYYRDLFDRIGVQVNFIRVGRFKSAGEPFISNAPSPEALEADAYWMDAAWAGYVKDVEQARRLPEGALTRLIAELPARLAAAQGNLAQLAVSERLVDGLKTRDELRALMIERGTKETSNGSFRQIALADYRASVKEPHGGAAVGVIVAAGEIFDDAAPPGRIGGRSTAELVRRAREDDDIKAIVLRVDSPGGSTFGSELIRRELEVTRAAGKPVVVSMSDVAASGGYWIATAADEIFADAGTITGSIGIFSILPTVDGALDRLGVHTGGHTTTWVAGADDPRRPLDPRMAEVVRAAIGNGYREFIGHVARARKLPEDQVEQIAQGRVWTGAQAKERGLVDTLGGLRPAIAAAATRAQLGDAHRLVYVERDLEGWQRVMRVLEGTVVGARAVGRAIIAPLQALGLGPRPAGARDALSPLPVGPVAEAAARLAGLAAADPRGAGGRFSIDPGWAAPWSGAVSDLRWLAEVRTTPLRGIAHCLCDRIW